MGRAAAGGIAGHPAGSFRRLVGRPRRRMDLRDLRRDDLGAARGRLPDLAGLHHAVLSRGFRRDHHHRRPGLRHVRGGGAPGPPGHAVAAPRRGEGPMTLAAPQTGMTLQFKDLVLSYGGKPVINRLDLQVRPGEILVLTGPSGCGKSTVLRALAGLLSPDAGEVLAEGEPVRATSRDRALVFQDNALLPWRTVQSNVELALKLAGT